MSFFTSVMYKKCSCFLSSSCLQLQIIRKKEKKRKIFENLILLYYIWYYYTKSSNYIILRYIIFFVAPDRTVELLSYIINIYNLLTLCWLNIFNNNIFISIYIYVFTFYMFLYMFLYLLVINSVSLFFI